MAKLKAVRDGKQIERDWENNPRWDGITRDYTADDVLRLRGSIDIEHTLAEMGADRLWDLLNDTPYVTALGALTGNQAIQQVRAGLKSIYLSGCKLRPTRTWPARCIPIRVCIRRTQSRRL